MLGNQERTCYENEDIVMDKMGILRWMSVLATKMID